MWTDGLVMPASELHVKLSAQSFAHPRSCITTRRVEVDMRMKTLDLDGVFFHRAQLHAPETKLFPAPLHATQPYCRVWTVPGGYHHSPTLQSGHFLGIEPRVYSGTPTSGFTAPSKVPSRVTLCVSMH